jgi:hypothetical protein
VVVPEDRIEEVLERSSQAFPELGGTCHQRPGLDPTVGDGGKGIQAGFRSLQFDEAGDPDGARRRHRATEPADRHQRAGRQSIVGLAAQPLHLQACLLVKQNGLTQHMALIEGESRNRLNAEHRGEPIHDLICAWQAARTESDFDLRHRSSP